MKISLVDDVLDAITCAKFQNEIFKVTILQGVEFSIFLLIFKWALQHCSATACDSKSLVVIEIEIEM